MEEHFQNKPRNFPFEVNFDVYYFETFICDSLRNTKYLAKEEARNLTV